MPSLKQLTGRPSPMAWPDPAEAYWPAKPCNVRPWPFRVMDWNEEMVITSPKPAADGKVVNTTPTGDSASTVATGAISAADIARRTHDPKSKGLIEAARLVHDNLTATTVSAKAIDANSVTAVFPGALHTDSVTAAWAMRHGLGHLVKPR